MTEKGERERERERAMKTPSTAVTRPSWEAGVATGTSVDRIVIDTMSAPDATRSCTPSAVTTLPAATGMPSPSSDTVCSARSIPS